MAGMLCSFARVGLGWNVGARVRVCKAHGRFLPPLTGEVARRVCGAPKEGVPSIIKTNWEIGLPARLRPLGYAGTTFAGDRQKRLFMALPEPDFKYRSSSLAIASVSTAT